MVKCMKGCLLKLERVGIPPKAVGGTTSAIFFYSCVSTEEWLTWLYSCCTNQFMEERIKHLTEALLRAVSKMNRNEKKARSYGTDVMLHPSEVHAAMQIGRAHV